MQLVGKVWLLELKVRDVCLVRVVAMPILAALSQLHSVGWVHCDVCPDTICLSSDGTWRLMHVENSKRVENLSGSTHCMSNTSPEALLEALVTEKADIWQLAASFCEVITRVRVVQQVLNKAGSAIAEKLCNLIDFCGPLPANLVAGYPNRDVHFTPEGQILRAVSLDTSGTAFLEVIEPVVAATCTLDGTPRPHLLVQALEGVDASLEILEFVGLLLHPDPDKRPSATSAASHPFLQQKLKVSTETGNPPGGPDVVERRVTIPDIYQGSQQPIKHSCTHFVHPHEMPPPSDDNDDDNDDDNEGSAFSSILEEEEKLRASPSCRRESALSEPRFRLSRKATGFIHASDLAFSDDDDSKCNDAIDDCSGDDDDDDDGSEYFNVHKGK